MQCSVTSAGRVLGGATHAIAVGNVVDVHQGPAARRRSDDGVGDLEEATSAHTLRLFELLQRRPSVGAIVTLRKKEGNHSEWGNERNAYEEASTLQGAQQEQT